MVVDNREQLEKVLELMGEEPTRRIHLTILAALVLFGMALQGLAWWYRVQAVTEEWAAVPVRPFEPRQAFWPLLLPHREMLPKTFQFLIDAHRSNVNRSFLIYLTVFG